MTDLERTGEVLPPPKAPEHYVTMMAHSLRAAMYGEMAANFLAEHGHRRAAAYWNPELHDWFENGWEMGFYAMDN